MDGAAGFEPAKQKILLYDGVKARCLTAWRCSNIKELCSYVAGTSRIQNRLLFFSLYFLMLFLVLLPFKFVYFSLVWESGISIDFREMPR